MSNNIDIYTNSEGYLVVKGDAKLDTEQLELLIASLMLELADRMPLSKEEAELMGVMVDEQPKNHMKPKGNFKVKKRYEL